MGQEDVLATLTNEWMTTEQIATQLGISNTAVKRSLRKLIKNYGTEDIEIDNQHRTGYRYRKKTK